MNKRMRKKHNKLLSSKLVDAAVSQLRPGQHLVAVMSNNRKTIRFMIVDGQVERTCSSFEAARLYMDDIPIVDYRPPRLNMTGDIIAEGVVITDVFKS